ncbi:MAG: PAS domain S-box protein [Bacillota bacterium]
MHLDGSKTENDLEIIKNLPYPIYVIDAEDYTIKKSNLELPEKKDKNLFCYSISHSYDSPCDEYGKTCPLKMVKEHKESVVVVHQHYNKKGERRYYEVHCYPIFNQKGNVKQVIEYSLDITERKQAEQKLQKNIQRLKDSRQFIQSIFNSLNANICVLDEHGTIQTTNQSWKNFARKNSENNKYRAIGKNYIKVCMQVEGEEQNMALEFANGIKAVLRGEKSFFEQEYPCHSENKKRWFIGRVTPLKTSKGNISGVVVFHINITERKINEQILQRFRDALDSSGDSIFIIDYPSYSFIDVNKRACFELGYDKEELLELTPFDIKPEISRQKLTQIFEEIIKSYNTSDKNVDYEAVKTFETLHQRKNGTQFPVEISLHIFKNPEENILFIASVRDITKRKEVEKALKENKKRLQKEIEKARHIHEKTLPKAIPEIDGMDVFAYYQPAAEIGGDFYNIIKLENKLFFYISDITGHGLDAAMMNSFVKNTINSYINLLPEDTISDPSEVLNFLAKRYIQENYPYDYFITILLGVIDPQNNNLTYSSAGMHIPPILIHNGKLTELAAGNMPISTAIPVEQQNYYNENVQIPADATLFFATDGLTEQKSSGDEYRTRHYSILQEKYHLPTQVLAETINNDFKQFSGQLTGDDDITYIIFANRKEYRPSRN